MQTFSIYKCQYRSWLMLLIAVEILLIPMFYVPILFTPWVSASIDSKKITIKDSTFDPSSFEGSIGGCLSGCSDDFFTNSNIWCSEQSSPEVISLCSTFDSLKTAAVSFFAIYTISSLGFLLMTIITCKSYKNNSLFIIGIFASASSGISYVLAFVVWNVITGVSYDGTCKDFPNGGEKLRLCASTGPMMIIVVSILYPIFVLIFSFVYYRSYLIAGRNEDAGRSKAVNTSVLDRELSSCSRDEVKDQEFAVKKHENLHEFFQDPIYQPNISEISRNS